MGQTIFNECIQAIEKLAVQVAEPGSPESPRALPERCDAEWFETQFLNGQQHDPNLPIIEQLAALSVFMPVFLLLAVPCIAERFFEPEAWVVREVSHRILGSSAQVSGVKHQTRAELRMLVSRLMLKGAVVNNTTCGIKPSEVFHIDDIGSFSISDRNPGYMDVVQLQSSRIDAVHQTGLYGAMLQVRLRDAIKSFHTRYSPVLSDSFLEAII